MATGRTVDEKKADWSLAFEFIEANLNPPLYKQALDIAMKASGEGQVPLPAAVALARMVSANTRAAAMVAALITQTGIKPVSLDLEDE
jgi:hypothetical protein